MDGCALLVVENGSQPQLLRVLERDTNREVGVADLKLEVRDAVVPRRRAMATTRCQRSTEATPDPC